MAGRWSWRVALAYQSPADLAPCSSATSPEAAITDSNSPWVRVMIVDRSRRAAALSRVGTKVGLKVVALSSSVGNARDNVQQRVLLMVVVGGFHDVILRPKTIE